MKFKNWLIKKLGGYTIAEYEDLKEDLKDVNIELEKNNADSLELIDASENFIKESDCYISKLKEDLEKSKKAIKIIKDNKVNIELLLKTDNVNQYNRVRYFYDYADYLTPAKYEQLKEVVKNVRS